MSDNQPNPHQNPQQPQHPGKPPSKFKTWWAVSNGGERLGAGIGLIALAIPLSTFVWLFAQSLQEGVCGSACVTRGWYGVFAVFAAVPVALVGLVIFAISNEVRKRRQRGR